MCVLDHVDMIEVLYIRRNEDCVWEEEKVLVERLK